jgi:hypothetical protein
VLEACLRRIARRELNAHDSVSTANALDSSLSKACKSGWIATQHTLALRACTDIGMKAFGRT